jgi:organic radical activating enzyme
MYTDLEISITERCNLRCPYCSVGIFLSPPDRELSLAQIEKYSTYFKGIHFRSVRITGGEPMLHPEFAEISSSLKRLFDSSHYILITNGILLHDFKSSLQYYDRVNVSHHVGINDDVIPTLPLATNIYVTRREKDFGVTDIACFPNKGKEGEAIQSCQALHIRKISGDRLFPCCLANGICTIRKIDREEFSIPLTENWKEDIEKLNIRAICTQCFYDGRKFD